jgi:hypothetical protein
MAIITIGLVVLAIILISPCAIVRAEQIKIGLSGWVDYVSDSYNLLGNKVHQGDLITGYYIYDSTTPDSDPGNTHDGVYEHLTSPYGIFLSVGSLTFQTDPTNVDFIVGLRDNYNSPRDYFLISSHNNLDLNTGISIDNIGLELVDNTGDVLSNDILPSVPPDLSKWQYDKSFLVSGGKYPFPSSSEKTLFNFSGHIESVWLIPEPATAFLFGLGLMLARKKLRK